MKLLWSPVLFRAVKRIWKIARKVGRPGVSAVVVACCRGIVAAGVGVVFLMRPLRSSSLKI